MLGGERRDILPSEASALQVRFERLKIRQEKVGEAKTFEQFMKEEKAKNEIYIPRIGKKADFKIENNGTLEEFRQQVNKLFPVISSPSLVISSVSEKSKNE